ncbi:Uncharacterized protein YR821_3152 [Yersinia ruckeri]|uniref:Uncharacterized protein n=1 Tax=Yersinia ruckeri TaxID=29486 RepID=A0A0A8VLW2_YERRU|nr:hypothetical protein yruck0001_2450 [Yersinia ruckeri ATCC 29473]QTD78068.1 Uncharacterized protein YR821_3152 [Yersinia ruckeri]CEK28984.1 hypothetical protein CSF007_16310 [Yersinia ruckeri]
MRRGAPFFIVIKEWYLRFVILDLRRARYCHVHSVVCPD